MGKLIDPWLQRPVETPRSLTTNNPDVYTKEHAVEYTGDQNVGQTAVRFNRALRDKRMVRPGIGRWVEYILPDLRRVYVEANLRKTYLGRLPKEMVTARVVIKPGGMEYTNNLRSLLFMGMVEASGDMLDVVRTADKVGLYVPDPETRGQLSSGKDKLAMSLVKQADHIDRESISRELYGLFGKMTSRIIEKDPERKKDMGKEPIGSRSILVEKYEGDISDGPSLFQWKAEPKGEKTVQVTFQGKLMPKKAGMSAAEAQEGLKKGKKALKRSLAREGGMDHDKVRGLLKGTKKNLADPDSPGGEKKASLVKQATEGHSAGQVGGKG